MKITIMPIFVAISEILRLSWSTRPNLYQKNTFLCLIKRVKSNS